MRAKEFIPFKLTEDINGHTDYRNLIYMVESSYLGEAVEQNDITYLTGLRSSRPVIGHNYSVAMVICLPKSQIMLHGSKEPIQLTRIFNEAGLTIYEFANGKRFPEARNSNLSFTKTYLFRNGKGLTNFLSSIALKFKTTTDLNEAPIPAETDPDKAWLQSGVWNHEYFKPGELKSDEEWYKTPADDEEYYDPNERNAMLRGNQAQHLGTGAEAVVIKYDASHEVVKILGTDAKLSQCAHLQYLLACKKYANSNPYLPRIESIKTVNYDGTRLLYTITMEALEEFDVLGYKEYDAILNRLFGEPNEPGDKVAASDIARAISKVIRKGNFTGVIDKLFIQAAQIIRAVAQRVDPKGGISDLIDLHSGNVMARRTSVGPQLVITDPLYSGPTGVRDSYSESK